MQAGLDEWLMIVPYLDILFEQEDFQDVIVTANSEPEESCQNDYIESNKESNDMEISDEDQVVWSLSGGGVLLAFVIMAFMKK
jgi:hypothetical protein